MTRRIAWQDLAVIRRYQTQRMVLDNSLRFVFDPGLFSSSLLSVALPTSEYYSAIEPLESDRYPFLIGQILTSKDTPTARVASLGPSDLGADPDYSKLLGHLSKAAAERGALQMVAEALVGSPEEGILYRSGFRPFADQHMWKLPRKAPCGSGQMSWIPAIQADNGPTHTFYQRVVPARIQHLEPAPVFPKDQGLISWRDGQVVGIVLPQYGPKGILVDVVLDPLLDPLDEYLAALMFHLPYTRTREIYLRIRDYQSGIISTLDRWGAEAGDHQKAMVKRLAVHYNAQQAFVVQGFEQQPDITTPISSTKIKN
jgi:hypothetical protein